jgi:hypothetical protein
MSLNKATIKAPRWYKLPPSTISATSGHHQAYRTTRLPAQLRVTFENSPSKVAPVAQPFIHLISAEAVVSAESAACTAENKRRARQRLKRCGNRAKLF